MSVLGEVSTESGSCLLTVDTVLCCRVVPEFLPPTPDRLSRRAGGLEQLTCDEVKKAKIYFPGYRALVRL